MISYKHLIDVNSLTEPARTIVGHIVLPAWLKLIYDRGLDIHVSHDLATVGDFYDRWPKQKPILQTFDPAFQRKATAADTFLTCLTRGTEVVGLHCFRHWWCEGSLHDEMQSLRLFYDDPHAMRRPGEICLVQPEITHAIRACHIVLNGAGILIPELRSQRLYPVMARLSRLLALVMTRWQWMVSLVHDSKDNPETKNYARDLPFAKYGVSSVWRGVYRYAAGDVLRNREFNLTATPRWELSRLLFRKEAASFDERIYLPTPAEIAAADIGVRQ